MATSYKLFGEGNYIDSTGIVHNRVVLSDILNSGGTGESTIYYKKYEKIYTTIAETESVIPIGISDFNEVTILFVDIDGLDLAENEDYTINYADKTITLIKPLDVVGTRVHFIVLKTISAAPQDYDLLKGKDGGGLPAGGTAGQTLIKQSDEDQDAIWGETSAIVMNRWEGA